MSVTTIELSKQIEEKYPTTDTVDTVPDNAKYYLREMLINLTRYQYILQIKI